MTVIDKLKDRKSLDDELRKQGLKIVESDDDVPQIEITDEDMDDPKKITAKLNKALAVIAKNSHEKIKSVKEESVKEASSVALQEENRRIREFLVKHKHTDPVKNKDILDLMDFYYTKGESLEDCYKKACKSSGVKPGLVSDEDDKPEDKKGEKKKTSEDTPEENNEVKKENKTKKSAKSDDFESTDEDTSNKDKKQEPLSIRDAAKAAYKEVSASLKAEGIDNPFEPKEE